MSKLPRWVEVFVFEDGTFEFEQLVAQQLSEVLFHDLDAYLLVLSYSYQGEQNYLREQSVSPPQDTVNNLSLDFVDVENAVVSFGVAVLEVVRNAQSDLLFVQVVH